jgi:hypothetical protein
MDFAVFCSQIRDQQARRDVLVIQVDDASSTITVAVPDKQYENSSDARWRSCNRAVNTGQICLACAYHH